MKNYLRLLRPKHYVKNVLVLLPLFFSGRFFERMPLCVGLLGFAAFCLLSSLVYIVNDLRDAPADRLHPTKCRRPIASGAVGVPSALALAAALGAAVLLLGILARFPAGSWLCMGVYLLVNLGYSFGLKNVPILDVALLVSGFLLRVLFGASVTGITISNWLYLTVVSISFYLALGKRRGELRRQSDTARPVLRYYNDAFLSRNMSSCLTLAVVFYSLWSVDEANAGTYLVWTVPLVLCLCLKYSLTVGDPVEVIYGDKVLLVLIALFAAVTTALLYGV